MNFIKTVIAVLVAHILIAFTLLIGFGFFGALLSAEEPVQVTDGSWLVMDVYGEIPPYNPPESIVGSVLGDESQTLTAMLTNLEKAAVDARISGVVLKISSSNSLGYASLGEMREAIERVRDAGKMVIAYSDALDRNALYLASACDSIFMPPVADVVFTGYGATEGFIKGTLDKLGIHQNLHKIKDYKTAAEPVMFDSMSVAAKEMANWMMDEMWDIELGAIARDRGLPEDSLVACMRLALFNADEAEAAGLVDGVMYWDELETRLGEGEELTTISSESYNDVSRHGAGIKGKERIAVVHAYGMIAGRTSHVDPTLGVLIGHESVIADLRAAAEDSHVKAILFRIDSPGGESLASELIAREVGKVATKKPVIVYMGDVAASGGYAVAYRATKIVGDSLTITGSIGSIYGKINLGGMWNKLGMTFDWVTKGPNALLWSDVHDFSPEQWARVEAHHNASFERWLVDIAEARKIPVDELRPLTEGRVWTGRQAQQRGLIDDAGGYSRAIELAKEAANIPADDPVVFVNYPKQRGLYELIRSGDAPITIARYVMYRFIHHDVATALHSLRSGELRLFTGKFE